MSIASARAVLALLAGPLLLGVAGCSSTTPAASTFIASADVTGTIGDVSATQSVRGADMSLALASMPEPGGSQINMREKVYANGLKQEIVLAGDKSGLGENILQVTLQSAPPTAGARDQVPLVPPSERGIKQEIVARYPQVDMQILTQPRRNGLGPFGLAIGKTSSGVRCIFAWQWIDDVRSPGSSSSTLGKLGSLGSSGQPASIRVHMCRKDATVDDLAMAVEGLTLAPSSVIDRALESRAVAGAAMASARVSGGSGIVASAGDGTLEGALSATHSRTSVASAPSSERKRVAHRTKKHDAVAEDESSAQQSPVATAPMMQTGPRYLAPVAGMPAAQPYAAPAATAYNTSAYSASSYGGAAPSTKALDPSLPAAAYRGPSSRTQ